MILGRRASSFAGMLDRAAGETFQRPDPLPQQPGDAAEAEALHCFSGQEITIFLSGFGRCFAIFKGKKATSNLVRRGSV